MTPNKSTAQVRVIHHAQHPITRLWGLVKAAPVMIPVVYGIPSVWLTLAVLCLFAGIRRLLGPAKESGEIFFGWSVITIFMAILSYWVTASLCAFILLRRKSLLWQLGVVASQKAEQVDAPTGRVTCNPELNPSDGVNSAVLPLSIQPPQWKFKRIGIILSGGGAKGVYQAGAMKAIYEFLDHHKTVDAVVSVAGTSIGSWNTLFWLAGLVA